MSEVRKHLLCANMGGQAEAGKSKFPYKREVKKKTVGGGIEAPKCLKKNGHESQSKNQQKGKGNNANSAW